ncbi:MAG: PLP-dependent aminotransferase family protein [Clostridia bacterium]
MEYKFSDKISTLKASAIREILKHTSNPEIVPFAAGNPSPESFPIKEMNEISDKIFKSSAVPALQYGITEGYAPLRDVTRERLHNKFSSGNSKDDLIIVSGAQQGIELACKVLCNEGDTIICENPSFIGALNAFRSYNVNLYGVELESDGININALENALKTQKNVRFIYLIPTFQNPSGITTSLEKRKAIYALAVKYNVLILEDNPYGELRFSGEEIPTIKSLDKENIVIYCGSYSKVLSAGIRVGFVLAPKEVTGKIVVAKQVADVHTNTFFQMMAYEFITGYDYDAHIAKIKALYKLKASYMITALKENLSNKASYIVPEGGLFLWLTLPLNVDITSLVNKLLANKIAVVPGSAFMANPEDKCHSLRLNYSTPSDEQIKNGTVLMCKLINEEL